MSGVLSLEFKAYNLRLADYNFLMFILMEWVVSGAWGKYKTAGVFSLLSHVWRATVMLSCVNDLWTLLLTYSLHAQSHHQSLNVSSSDLSCRDTQ